MLLGNTIGIAETAAGLERLTRPPDRKPGLDSLAKPPTPPTEKKKGPKKEEVPSGVSRHGWGIEVKGTMRIRDFSILSLNPTQPEGVEENLQESTADTQPQGSADLSGIAATLILPAELPILKEARAGITGGWRRDQARLIRENIREDLTIDQFSLGFSFMTGQLLPLGDHVGLFGADLFLGVAVAHAGFRITSTIEDRGEKYRTVRHPDGTVRVSSLLANGDATLNLLYLKLGAARLKFGLAASWFLDEKELRLPWQKSTGTDSFGSLRALEAAAGIQWEFDP